MGSSLSHFWAHSKGVRDSQKELSGEQGASDRSGVNVFQDADNVQVNGGNITAAGRDIRVNINHFHGPRDLDLVLKIQDWLSPDINYRNIQIDTFNKRAPDTGTWFLESRKFKQWLEGKDGILWGIGIPGAGKTILASTVIDHLQKLAEKYGQGKISVTFAYCRYTDAVPIKVILAALLRQLLEDHPGLVEIIEPLYAKHQRHKTQPTQNELVDLLIKISSMFETIFFVLDGLDEAPQDDQFDLIKILASVKVHFIITSRPLKNLEHVIPGIVFFEVVARKEDIRVHVTQRIDQMLDLGRLLDRHSAREEVISTICEKADGMFLHAILQVEMLRSCLTMKKVREALQGLPAKNDEMYMVTLDRIRKQSQERASLALRILVWLVFTQRSLTVQELQYAISVCLDTHTFDPEDIVDEELLVSVCCGLVTVDAESRLVRLIHFTAKDALEHALRDDFPDPHAFLASTCISQLISCHLHESKCQDEDELEEVLWGNPFLRYAYDTWYIHVKRSNPSSASEHVSTFLESCHCFPIDVWTVTRNCFDRLSGLQVAAYYDLVNLVDIGSECNTPTPIRKFTPLMLALLGQQANPQHGSAKSVMLLLESPGIQVNTVATDGSTALKLSAIHGYEKVVKRLLQFSDIGLNVKDNNACQAAFILASGGGHAGVVNALFRYPGVEVNGTDGEGQTALICASQNDHEGVVDLLLDHTKVNVNAGDNDGWTAMTWACANGCLDVVRLLLRRCPWVDINAADGNGRTPLMWASYCGKSTVVGLLLDHADVAVNVADRRGHTALMQASRCGELEVAQKLLEHYGIEIDKRDRWSHTAFDIAVCEGHYRIAQSIDPSWQPPIVIVDEATDSILDAFSGYIFDEYT